MISNVNISTGRWSGLVCACAVRKILVHKRLPPSNRAIGECAVAVVWRLYKQTKKRLPNEERKKQRKGGKTNTAKGTFIVCDV